jgi:hypothetical protein
MPIRASRSEEVALLEVDLREGVEAVGLLVDIPELPIESFGDLNLLGPSIRSAGVSLEKASLCSHARALLYRRGKGSSSTITTR